MTDSKFRPGDTVMFGTEKYKLIERHFPDGKPMWFAERGDRLILLVEADLRKLTSADDLTSLTAIIKDLERCAKQNEADVGHDDALVDVQAIAVACEQRRMIRLLKTIQGNRMDTKLTLATQALKKIRKIGYDAPVGRVHTAMVECLMVVEKALGEIEK